jgi:DNA-binding transcriptional MerR regulator
MRMNELEERADTPRSTIHYYIQQGLLPPPRKQSRNSAVYSDRHLVLLLDLAQLRKPPLGPLPLPTMKRIAARLRTGTTLETALSLEQAMAGMINTSSQTKRLGKQELCQTVGVSNRFLNDLIESGLIVPDVTDQSFDSLDMEMVRVYDELMSVSGISPRDGRPIADGIRAISQLEMDLRNASILGKSALEAGQITLQMERSSHAIRNYLFYRARLAELTTE